MSALQQILYSYKNFKIISLKPFIKPRSSKNQRASFTYFRHIVVASLSLLFLQFDRNASHWSFLDSLHQVRHETAHNISIATSCRCTILSGTRQTSITNRCRRHDSTAESRREKSRQTRAATGERSQSGWYTTQVLQRAVQRAKAEEDT